MNSLDKRTGWEFTIMAFKVLWIMYTSFGVIEGVSDGDSFMEALSLFFMGIGVGVLTMLKAWFKDSFMESEATSITMGETLEQYPHEDGKIHARRVPIIPPNYKLSWASSVIMLFLIVLEATMGMFTSTSYSTTLLNKRVTSSLEYKTLKSFTENRVKANEQYLEAMRLYNAQKTMHKEDCNEKWGDKYKTKRQQCYNQFKGNMPPTQDGIKVDTAVSLEDVKQIKEQNKNVFLDFSIPILFIFVLSLLEFIENIMANARLNKFKNNAKKAQESNGFNSFLASAKEMEFDSITTDAIIAKKEALAKNKLKRAEAEKRAREIEEKADKILSGDINNVIDTVKKTIKESKDNFSSLSTAVGIKEEENPPKSNIDDENKNLAKTIKELTIRRGEMIDVQEGMLSGEYLKLPKNNDLAQLLNMSPSTCDRKVKDLIAEGLLDIVKVGAGNKTARILIP